MRTKALTGFNNYVVDGETTYIELTDRSGLKKAEMIIDTEDLQTFLDLGCRIHCKVNKTNVYARVIVKAKYELAHRFLLGFPSEVIDHINHNGLDNRKANLRICDSVLNARNKRMQSNNTVGARNVFFRRGNRKRPYAVRFSEKKQSTFYCTCTTLNIARLTAEMARVQLWGNWLG